MGSTTIAALIIIAVHLLVCMTLCLLHHVGVLKVDGLLLPFMALIPLWGPLSVALMHSRAVLRGGRRIPAGLQELKVEDQEQRNILVDDRTDYANTVPLEEALIVDNPRQRRNLMLSILNENPGQYANLLSQARLNEDVEVVHYAATAMAQISAKEDIALQQRMEEYERNRDSDEALDRYREALEHYLKSSMEQGYARTCRCADTPTCSPNSSNGITTTAPYARWRRRRWISVRSMPRLAPSKRRCPHGRVKVTSG